jgi:superfamily II DNA/RNA helicase
MQSLFLSLFVCLAALGRVSGLVKGPFLDLRTFVTKYKPTTALGDSSSSSVFAGVRFDEPIASSLKSLNIHEPSPIQEQAILALSTGLSCIIHAETGSGKTLCYLLPLLKRLMDEKKKNDNDNDNSKIMSIIVVPSKELAVQVAADVASMMGQSDDIDTRLVHLCLESGRAGLDGIRAPIVIGTPYKLLDAVRATQSVQSLDSVNYLVLDEVDRMLHALSKYSSNDVRRKERQIANPVKELIGDLARIRGFMPPDKNGGNSKSPLQVVAASATIGRPVRRELYHALMGGGQRSASSSGELPLLRAKAAAAAVQVADDRETTTKRAVSVPRSIRHIALLRNDQSDSLTNKVATAKTMWTNGAMKGAQKALLFVPTSGDVQQVVGMLGFMGHAGEVVDLQQQLGITTNRDDNNASAGGVRGKQAVCVLCSMFFLLSFLFLFVMSLSLSYPSIAACLHTLTPHDTSLTIIPSNQSIINRHIYTRIPCYNTGTRLGSAPRKW